MIRLDEKALICDLAETYGIYTYKSLPARLAATFSVGLRENSRIKQKMYDEPAPRDFMVQAIIADRLGIICYALSGKKSSPPPLLTAALFGSETSKTESGNVRAFSSPEEFIKAWKGGE